MAESQSDPQNQAAKSCNVCNTHPPVGKSLFRCSLCKDASYCSKDCQKEDWSQHKGTCVGFKRKLLYPELAGYFHDKNENKAYQRIVDCFRLRVEDDYTWDDHNHGIYAMRNPLPDFKDFLNRAERAAVLPEWWSAEKRQACIRRAMDEDGSAYIGHAVEKPDIQEYYKDITMPMELRMVAERVYGGGYGMGQKPMPDEYRCRCDYHYGESDDDDDYDSYFGGGASDGDSDEDFSEDDDTDPEEEIHVL